jgi:uncharacterized protein (TIGR00251 family)
MRPVDIMKYPGKKHKKGLVINVKVEPRSSRAGITGPYGEGLRIRLTSPPVEGRANKELVAILAKEFGIKKSDVEILSGKKSKNKRVKLTGVKDIESILKKI